MLRIDSQGYALVLERQAPPDYKANSADDAWNYQLERGYAPLTLPHKNNSRNEEGAAIDRSPSPELATPQDYEVPISLPLSIPSPRLVRQKRVLSETEEIQVDDRESASTGQELLEEVVEEQNSSQVELLQADKLRVTGAASVQPTPTTFIPTRPRAMTVGAQGVHVTSRSQLDTQPQRKSLPTTLHICLNQQSGVVV